jgi:hypothetical protein
MRVLNVGMSAARPSDEVSIPLQPCGNAVGPTLLTPGGALPLPTIVGSSTDVDVSNQVAVALVACHGRGPSCR